MQGTVTTVYVEDNQVVQAGQPLVDLDPRDATVSLAQAQANYDQSVAQLNAENPSVPITQATNVSDIASQQAEVQSAEAALSAANSDYQSAIAELRQAEATNQKSQSDLSRYRQLLDKQEIANSEYDQYLSTARRNKRWLMRLRPLPTRIKDDSATGGAVTSAAREVPADKGKRSPASRN